jgi:hypothetical protein
MWKTEIIKREINITNAPKRILDNNKEQFKKNLQSSY